MSFGESYSLRKITNWLKQNNINDYIYTSSGFCLYETGIRVKINDTYDVSIQTNPTVAGSAFCETALINNQIGDIEYNEKLGYDDVIKHPEQEDLFNHITFLIKTLNKTKK